MDQRAEEGRRRRPARQAGARLNVDRRRPVPAIFQVARRQRVVRGGRPEHRAGDRSGRRGGGPDGALKIAQRRAILPCVLNALVEL